MKKLRYYALTSYQARSYFASQTPIFINSPIPDAEVGVPYSYVPIIGKGQAPFSFSLSGNLPAGLLHDPVTGTISGTPLTNPPGAVEFTQTVIDAYNRTRSQTFNLTVEGVEPDFVVVTPGSTPVGSWMTTAVPAAIGNPGDYGIGYTAITGWDTEPYVDVNGDRYFGIYGWHVPTDAQIALYGEAAYDLERIEVASNNGTWAVCNVQNVNPDTGVFCFVIKIEGANIPLGYYEMRALAYPRVGLARAMQGVVTYNGSYPAGGIFFTNVTGQTPTIRYVDDGGAGSDANAGTEGSPKATIRGAVQSIATAQGGDAGGGIVYLKAGTYNAYDGTLTSTTNATRFVTIQPAPGVAKADVIINYPAGGSGGINIGKQRWKGLTFNDPRMRGNNSQCVVLEDCDILGNTELDQSRLWNINEFATGFKCAINCTQTGGQDAFIGCHFTRGCHVQSIRSDCYQGTRRILYCTAAGTMGGRAPDRPVGDGNVHPDTQQINLVTGNTQFNYVIYHLVAFDNMSSQGLFLQGGGVTGIAVVDSIFGTPANTGRNNFYVQNILSHAVFLRTQFTSGLARWDVSTCDCVDIANTTFLPAGPGPKTGVRYKTIA